MKTEKEIRERLKQVDNFTAISDIGLVSKTQEKITLKWVLED